jgi:hypothetical protein
VACGAATIVGRYATATGQTSEAEACTGVACGAATIAGRYANVTGQTSEANACTGIGCSPGRYGNSTGLTADTDCALCAAGEFTEAEGAVECKSSAPTAAPTAAPITGSGSTTPQPTSSPTAQPTPQPTPSPTMLGYTYAPTAVLGDAVVPSDKSQEEEQTKTTLIGVGIIGFVTLLCIALVFLLFLVLLLIRKKKLDGGSNIQKSAKKKKKKKKKTATIMTVDSNSLSDVELQDGEAGGVSRAAGVWHTVNKAFKNKATSLPTDQSMPRGQATRQSTPRDITGIVGGTPWKHSDAFKQYISK